MDFDLKPMDLDLKSMDYVLKMMDYVLKMMDFIGQAERNDAESGGFRRREDNSRVSIPTHVNNPRNTKQVFHLRV